MTQEELKERPIWFETERVQAILEGRTTQTRQIMKPQPIDKGNGRWDFIPNKKGAWFNFEKQDFNLSLVGILDKCPYGKPGDILWVREAWAPLGYYPICNYTFMYKADVNQRYSKWKPSIYMPKAAARIWLRVVDVRVEGLPEMGICWEWVISFEVLSTTGRPDFLQRSELTDN